MCIRDRGVFLAQDLFLFYIFWEFTLVPMYFLIGIWGAEERIYAAVKFFLYTMAGSLLMLLAILWLGNEAGTFSVPDILAKLNNGDLTFSTATGRWLFLPLIAIIPTAEMVSVIIQVIYFKATGGKRVFKKTPIHHHFEMIGWEENQIVMRFWLIELIGAMLGLSMAFLS